MKPGFAGRYVAFDDDDDFERPDRRSLFWQLPLIVKIIVLLMSTAAGLIIGFVIWAIVGGLTH